MEQKMDRIGLTLLMDSAMYRGVMEPGMLVREIPSMLQEERTQKH